MSNIIPLREHSIDFSMVVSFDCRLKYFVCHFRYFCACKFTASLHSLFSRFDTEITSFFSLALDRNSEKCYQRSWYVSLDSKWLIENERKNRKIRFATKTFCLHTFVAVVAFASYISARDWQFRSRVGEECRWYARCTKILILISVAPLFHFFFLL